MPKNGLLRLSSKIWNTPHLITPQAFNVVLDFLDSRNRGIKMLMPTEDSPTQSEEDESNVEGLSVINIDGSLTYMPLQTMCGEVGTSYSSIVDQVEDAIENNCSTIILNVTSGGGEASHVFECAGDVRSMCDVAGVKLIAYADTLACSAAYALSVIADEIIVNPSATVGSIGCVVCLMDDSKAMEQAGYKRIFVTSGDSKVPYEADGSFKSDFLESVQKDVDELNVQFSEFVSKYTGISSETIRGMQANTFTAQEAIDNGLANKIMTNKQFASYVASIHKGGSYA